MKPSKEKAKTLRQRAVALEHPAAMMWEARLCLASWTDSDAGARAIQLVRRGMELHIAESYAIMGKLYSEYPKLVPTDPKEGERLFRLAASEGYPQAYYYLDYEEGMAHNVPKCFYWKAQSCSRTDAVQAVALYKRAAELGYMEACHMLGYMYKYGNGVGENMQEARKWYSLGAEYYEPNCLEAICNMIEQDSDMIVYKERLAMTGAQGAAEAAYWLFCAYSDASQAKSELIDLAFYGGVTDGTVAKDMVKAMGYLHRAAELNQYPKYALLYGLLATQGVAALSGQGSQEVNEGAQLEKVIAVAETCQKSFAVIAAARLSELYAEGKLVERDPLKALQYRHVAVEAGYEASLDPIRSDSCETFYHEKRFRNQRFEQARFAMNHFDMAKAFSLLIDPALDDYSEAITPLLEIANNDESLRQVPDEAFEVVRFWAFHSDPLALYLMARYYSVKHVDLNLWIVYASLNAEHAYGPGLYELGQCIAMTSMSEADNARARELIKKHTIGGN